jgi:hypothetical protein
MQAGRPGTSLPCPSTVSRDIKAAFKICRERIDELLKVSFWIYFMDCSFNLYIESLRAPTFCNRCMDIPKSPGFPCLDSAVTARGKALVVFT